MSPSVSLTAAASPAESRAQFEVLVAAAVGKAAPGGWVLGTGCALNPLALKRGFISWVPERDDAYARVGVVGGRWDHERWGGELPSAMWLDGVTRDVPVWLTRVDGHMGLANSAALRAADITSATADPPGGVILRTALDQGQGTPTGLLQVRSMQALQRRPLRWWSRAQGPPRWKL
jgi:hypothetical protein